MQVGPLYVPLSVTNRTHEGGISTTPSTRPLFCPPNIDIQPTWHQYAKLLAQHLTLYFSGHRTLAFPSWCRFRFGGQHLHHPSWALVMDCSVVQKHWGTYHWQQSVYYYITNPTCYLFVRYVCWVVSPDIITYQLSINEYLSHSADISYLIITRWIMHWIGGVYWQNAHKTLWRLFARIQF